VAADKRPLAMDEGTAACNKQVVTLGFAQTQEKRRAFLDLNLTTLGVGDSIRDAILFDQTIPQRTKGATPFADAVTDACPKRSAEGQATRLGWCWPAPIPRSTAWCVGVVLTPGTGWLGGLR
jgi:hypothetical protein